MSFEAITYNVMLASPGDVSAERRIAREVLAEWNAVHSALRRVVLLPLGWETHASPTMGMEPQDVINRQVLRNADLLIGIFWTRIGTATSTYASGTVEEIEEHIKASKPAMLYFSDAPVPPHALDLVQYRELQEFRGRVQRRGLFDTFASQDEFRAKFSRQLQLKLNNDEYFSGKELPAATLATDLVLRLQQTIDKYLITTTPRAESADQGATRDAEGTAATSSRLSEGLTTIAHQIQAPLLGVSTTLSAISADASAEMNADLVRHARALVDETIDVNFGTFAALALADGRSLSLMDTDLDLRAELKQIVERLQLTYPRPDVRVVMHCAPDLPPAVGDVRIFASVVSNVLHNAMRYADDSTDIVVECAQNDSRTAPMIKVKSIGTPILPSEREAIFERYRRGSSVEGGRLYRGVGLGLWVARQLMHAMGGAITLELAPDFPRLSAFAIYLPKRRR
jgi:signal transduction histidine kinase